jgi:hypothetical protein
VGIKSRGKPGRETLKEKLKRYLSTDDWTE